MTRFLLLAAVVAAAQFAAAAPITTGERLVSPTGVEAVRAYRDVEFLDLVPSGRERLWRVQSGVLQTSNDQGASWATAPSGLVARPLLGDWEGIQIAGAPAVAKEPFAIEYSLGPEFQFKASTKPRALIPSHASRHLNPPPPPRPRPRHRNKSRTRTKA